MRRNIMFKGIHYGKEVWLNWVNEEENALKQVINAMKMLYIQFFHQKDMQVYYGKMLQEQKKRQKK